MRKTIRQEQGYDPAAMMVLHTWNQRLDAHWHVHALVPGAGPGLDDEGLAKAGWKESRRPLDVAAADSQAECDSRYLVDAVHLRQTYRKFAIADLQRLRRRGELKFEGSLEPLQAKSP